MALVPDSSDSMVLVTRRPFSIRVSVFVVLPPEEVEKLLLNIIVLPPPPLPIPSKPLKSKPNIFPKSPKSPKLPMSGIWNPPSKTSSLPAKVPKSSKDVCTSSKNLWKSAKGSSLPNISLKRSFGSLKPKSNPPNPSKLMPLASSPPASYVLRLCGSESTSYASAISRKRRAASSRFPGFLSGCHFKACSRYAFLIAFKSASLGTSKSS
mmetsp:Transcript_36466/g.84134  ORF Transcript_36466/g.84134 Transcript_36466/m.84134 type:complete len:209 (+) Transcript_36466:148-774(+)